ncbi:MAG: hypothetical protein M3R53_09420 [Candidatus Eremiobacteraeota bacterium]|nr:hypothetical protein [Candidatus Eremiobacteraeota bacterium]
MKDEQATESDVSEAGPGSPAAPNLPDIEGTLQPTADVDIAGDIDGNERGFTYPGPGA